MHLNVCRHELRTFNINIIATIFFSEGKAIQKTVLLTMKSVSTPDGYEAVERAVEIGCIKSSIQTKKVHENFILKYAIENRNIFLNTNLCVCFLFSQVTFTSTIPKKLTNWDSPLSLKRFVCCFCYVTVPEKSRFQYHSRANYST